MLVWSVLFWDALEVTVGLLIEKCDSDVNQEYAYLQNIQVHMIISAFKDSM